MTVVWVALGLMGVLGLSVAIHGTTFSATRRLWSELEPEEKARRRRALLTRVVPSFAAVGGVLGVGALVGAHVRGGQDGWLEGVIVAGVGVGTLLFIGVVVVSILLGVRGERSSGDDHQQRHSED